MKILVVDDMERIREGIRSMLAQLPGETEPLQVRTANNGAQAVRLMEQDPADVVLTDIRMPVMDGIALMEHCHAHYPGAVVLVISGYDEFRYAQKAIECGAKAYLLKPIDKADLFRVVKQAAAEKRQQAAHRTRQEQTARSQHALFLHYIQGMGGNDTLLRDIVSDHPFISGPCDLLLLRAPENSHQAQSWRHQLMRHTADVLILEDEAQWVVLGAPGACRALPTSETGQPCQGTLICGISGPQELQMGYQQAREIDVHHILLPDKALLTLEDIKGMAADFTIPYDEIEQLIAGIGTAQQSQLKAALNGLFEREKLVRYRIGYTLALCDTLYRSLRRVEQQLQMQADLSALHQPLAFASMRNYLLFAYEQLLTLHQTAQQVLPVRHDHQAVIRAQQYIHANYHRPITLAMVSNEMSLNYAYFSDIFHRYTGKTFSEYLRDARLEAAKKLLQQPNMRIAQVSQQVGYDSYKSFYRAFKDAMGITPAEYQQQRSRRQQL